MKTPLTLLLVSFLGLFGQLRAQTICSGNSNLMIYSNYDGGIVTINVDANIPNLYIGICTYEPAQVTITGPFVGNVAGVIYAGFASTQGNDNCGLGDFPTTVTGVDASLIDINVNPPAGLANPNGWPNIVGVAGACSSTQDAGGGNTPDQVVFYFQQQTGAGLYAHVTQYECWINTTYNVSQGGNCCVEPASACVPPQVDPGSDISICPGQNANLGGSPTATGGSSSNYTYTWSPASGLSNPAAANPVASPTASTTYTLTVSNGPNCSTTETVSVTVDDQPTLNVTFDEPDLNLCAGENVVLTAQPGFSSYSWSNGATGQSITVSQNLQVSVSASGGAGCDASSETLVITVDPVFSIDILPEGPHNICADSILVLTAEAGLSNYVWSNNTQGNTLSVSQTGGYSVSAQNANGCTGSSSVVQVNSNPLPVASFTYEQLNDIDFTVQFTSTSQNTGAWFWDFGSGNTSDEQNPSFDFLFDDFWPVTLIAYNVCGSDTLITEIEVVKTSINDPLLEQLQYSIQAGELLVFGNTAKPTSIQVEVLSIHGQLLSKAQWKAAGNWSQSLTLPEVQGLYLVRLQTDLGSRTLRLISKP